MKRALLLLPILMLGCLPDDTRDEPASLTVNLRGGDTTINGVDTSDGWRVTFSRVIVTVGNLGLEGEGCSEYSGANYFRILDGRVAAPQRVGLLYGIGTCQFEFRARNPESDTLLGIGITEADKTKMRDGVQDPRETLPVGITFIVEGKAVKGATTKSFQWLHRRRRLAYDECKVGDVTTFGLASGEARVLELRVRAETLFQDNPDPAAAKLRFDPIAAADKNGDGNVTFEELDETELVGSGIDPEVYKKITGSDKWKKLGDYVYEALFPHILRVGEDGACAINRQQNGPGPPG